ncbi:unnamed protein product [Ilex paraguariensis]|uniref:Uncharacterized protein n=1 Tax=Ilex paraguariensis TaxID=185542 RepID=A0ABC8S397_9AQUA
MGEESIDSGAMLQGQAEIWQYMFNFADSMALKAAVELRIADIIHSHGSPITLSKIASGIASSSPDTTCLARIMRLLVRKKIFTANSQSNGGEPLYGLTPSSKWLLHDTDLSLAPMLLIENHPWAVAPWHCLSSCVKEGGIAFKKANGHEVWEFAALNPEFNQMFNEGMACTSKIALRAIISGYEDGFGCVKSVVDVGGGTGAAMAEIVKAYPHIKGINFDLPHVVKTAPEYHGISHVGGDMFEVIPKADAVFMKVRFESNNPRPPTTRKHATPSTSASFSCVWWEVPSHTYSSGTPPTDFVCPIINDN